MGSERKNSDLNFTGKYDEKLIILDYKYFFDISSTCIIVLFLIFQPPTYEILTMISKVVLVSTGRVMYYGKRREMLPYFAFIDYPCPAYKNPSDYYRKFYKSIIKLEKEE